MSFVKDVFLITLYFFIFAFIHSLLASQTVKKFFKKHLKLKIAFYRLAYNIISTILFFVLLYFMPKPHFLIYEVSFPFDLMIYALQVGSLFGLIWTTKYFSLKEFLGISQIKRYFQGNYKEDLDEMISLREDGPYKISRHPVYLFSIFFLVFRPYMTLFYLTIVINVIIYFYIGSYFEEKRLENLFGENYRLYKMKVSRIFPIKWLVKGS